MPLKAWRRAILCTLAGLTPLALLFRAALDAPPAWRVVDGLLIAAILATTGYLLWVYLPDVDLPGRTIRRGPRGRGRIAITFDDGPNGAHTTAVLDVLRRHRAKATFFCVGEAARSSPELVRRMLADGHEVGNHTLEHRILAWEKPEEVARQIRAAQEALVSAGAPRPRLFRAPKGFKSPHLPGVLAKERLQLVGWTRGVWDTDVPGVDVIVARARESLQDGAILLLHDGLPGKDRAQTARALDEILTECAKRGLVPVTVPELLARG
jgi:peptidoglycan/xylan/chitin deacetylase (PgdA/CDA1 family)